MDKQSIFLHSVIEVPKEQSIRCQAPSCTASVWKAVHVVVINGDIQLYGSSCFKKAFGHTNVASSGPSYGSVNGRLLTQEERLMLQANTQRLLERLEDEHREEIDRLAKLQALEDEKLQKEEQELERILSERNTATPTSPQKPDVATKAQALAEAKKRVRDEFGVNPDLAGWIGLVKGYETDILKEWGYE